MAEIAERAQTQQERPESLLRTIIGLPFQLAGVLFGSLPVSYTHLTLPTIYSV